MLAENAMSVSNSSGSLSYNGLFLGDECRDDNESMHSRSASCSKGWKSKDSSSLQLKNSLMVRGPDPQASS
jgi:hypothetical protein